MWKRMWLCVFICVFCVMSVELFAVYLITQDRFWSGGELPEEPKQTEQITLPYTESSALFGSIVSNVNTGLLEQDEELQQKLSDWQEVNPDVVCLVVVDELDILEPVVQATDSNKQWLRVNIYGESDNDGVVFVDYRCDFNKTAIKMLHGHNMLDGKMFARLPELMNLESCVDAPLIKIVIEQGIAYYQVYSIISINDTEEALPIDFMASYSETQEMVSSLLERSIVPDGEYHSMDTIVLNTCWYGESGQEHNLHCLVIGSRISPILGDVSLEDETEGEV